MHEASIEGGGLIVSPFAKLQLPLGIVTEQPHDLREITPQQRDAKT